MLFPEYKFYLASQSPRRKMLLEQAHFKFEILTKDVKELVPNGMKSDNIPEYLAKLKANAVVDYLAKENEIIISADTIVCLNEQIFGKPKNAKEAKNTLQLLSGKIHQVITGVCLTSLTKQVSFSETAYVYFKELNEEQIDFYIETYKPYDKAGAYAIQEWMGIIGIEKIEGCYFNIMGLPVSKLVTVLKDF